MDYLCYYTPYCMSLSGVVEIYVDEDNVHIRGIICTNLSRVLMSTLLRQKLSNTLVMLMSYSCRRFVTGRHTSKQAIIMPQAGAIFAIRGTTPAYKAEKPSLRTISFKTCRLAVAPDSDPPMAPDISNACRRVFKTSNGDVRRAAAVPLRAPLTKATPAPA